MKESGLFPEFREWQEGYGAFTCSVKEKAMIINYIKIRNNIIEMKILKMNTGNC